jgi:hypothetical protein
MWAALQQHFKDTAGKYIAGGVGMLAIGAGWASWDLAQSRAETNLLNFLGDALATDDPNKNADGSVRDATSARAVVDFQKKVVAFVGKQVKTINGGIIGYVQAGTFTLPYEEQTQIQSKKSKQNSFQIFAGDKSHVYLEFDISSFESDNYDMQLIFFEQPVCSKHQWTSGLNKVEFEVIDVISREWNFFDECRESQLPSNLDRSRDDSDATIISSHKGKLTIEGHRRQMIPVRLTITNKAREPRMTNFYEAASSSTNEISQTERKPEVTVGYIVVISPLIEDAILKKKENSLGRN